MCLSVLTGCLGWASHLTYDHFRRSVPFWPDQIHWWTGRLTVVFAYVTIILGLRQYQAPNIFMIMFSVVPGLYFILYMFLDAYIWASKRNLTHGPFHGDPDTAYDKLQSD